MSIKNEARRKNLIAVVFVLLAMTYLLFADATVDASFAMVGWDSAEKMVFIA